jgi:hypothetical protein
MVVGDRDGGGEAIGRVQDRDIGVVAWQAGHIGEVEVRPGMRRSQHIGATADALEVGEVDRPLCHHAFAGSRIRDGHDGRDGLVGGGIGGHVQVSVHSLGPTRIGRNRDWFGCGRTIAQ